MFYLGDELDAMDLPQLLGTLLDKLADIRSVVHAYPEAKLALIVAVNRLAVLTSGGFQINSNEISNGINDTGPAESTSPHEPQPAP
jgi:hypothetical protein